MVKKALPRISEGETGGMDTMLQNIWHKMENLEARLEVVESRAQIQRGKGETSSGMIGEKLTEEEDDSFEMNRPLEQLKRLREEEDFFTYVDSLVSLISQVELSDEDQVTMFVEGFKDDNKKMILVLQPKNLQQAIAYARALTAEEDPYTSRKRSSEQIVSIAHPEPNSTYDMSGDLDQQIKDFRRELKLSTTQTELFESIGIAQPTRELLDGLFGNGKIRLAEKVVHHTDGTVIRRVGSELVQKYDGKESRRVKELLVMAGEQAPLIILRDKSGMIKSARVENGSSDVQGTMLQFLNRLVGSEAADKTPNSDGYELC